jgi:hypothetical protein
MAKAKDKSHPWDVRVASRAIATLGEGSALALRRILFMYNALAAAAFSHPRNATLVEAVAGGVPHSMRLRAFLRACARDARRLTPRATRIAIS